MKKGGKGLEARKGEKKLEEIAQTKICNLDLLKK